MILDHLIAGYLDGDLTEDQDRELRAVVGADPLAKEAFDAAVLIHIALQCEDETVPPASLRSAVFEEIAALDAKGAAAYGQGAYQAQPRGSIRSQRSSTRRPQRSAVRMLATAAVFFLAMWLPFGDSLMGLRATLSALPELDRESVQTSEPVSTQQLRSNQVGQSHQQRTLADAQLFYHIQS